MNRKLGAVIIAVAVAVGIYFMTAEKKIEQTACGKVTIAEMNWASAELMANVDKIILEKGEILDGKLMIFNLLNMNMKTLNLHSEKLNKRIIRLVEH